MHFSCETKRRGLSDKTRNKEDGKKMKGNPESTGSFSDEFLHADETHQTVQNASILPDQY